MKLKLLIHRIREDFLDDTKRPELWDETATYGALNAAVADLCAEIDLIRDDSTFSLPVTASAYPGYSPLSQRITRVNDVWYTTVSGIHALEKKTYGEIQARTPSWRTAAASTPRYYLLDVQAGRIYIHPKPDRDGTIGMNVFRTWLKDYTPDDVMELADAGPPPVYLPIEVPDLKAIYHEKLIPGVLMRLYEKQDSEIFDEQLYQKYKMEWIENKEYIRRAEIKFDYRDRINVPLPGLV